MALRTLTRLRLFFSNASQISSSFSLKIPNCGRSTSLYSQFQQDCKLLPFTGQFHRTNTNINESLLSLSPSSPTSREAQHQSRKPPTETNIQGVEDTKREISTTSKVAVGSTVKNDSEKEKISLDQLVNSYPTFRRFIAIGSGGDDFADAMLLAVQSVLQKPIPGGSMRKRVSSRGRYISVNIGPVRVISRDQVKAVYEAMMKDARMRYLF